MKRVALIALALLLAVPVLVGSSGATFVATSASAPSTFSTAADFNTVAVSLADPGTPLRGTVALSATASSSRGIASVTFQSGVSGTWTDICTATVAPYTCAFATSSVPDGTRDLRAVATDAAGYSRVATVAARVIDNHAPAVTVVAPAAPSRGTLTLAVTLAGADTESVRYQFRPAGVSIWLDACTATSAPFTCSGDSTQIPDGDYEARAIVTDAAGNTATSAIVSGVIDNTAPSSAVLSDPGSPLTGTVALSASAADATSGIASVRFEHSGTTICTDTAAPYTCAWDTTAVADRSYDLRVVATDLAGNTRTSSTVASRRVDNTGPTVALTDPGSPLTGTVKLSASASDPSGVASVAIQRRPSGGSTWTTICTDATSGYSCSWATTGVGDATYDLQAVATDTLGRSSTSSLVAARRTENFAPTATDVQAVNGGGTAGRIDAGDVITFSYSEAIAPASLLSGWAGTSRTVSVRVTDAGTLDTLSVYDANNTTRIQLTPNATELALKADRTTGGARFSATMALSGGQVTVTLGSLITGSTKSSTSTTRMVWTPSTSATDLAGKAVSAAAVTESGTDMDF